MRILKKKAHAVKAARQDAAEGRILKQPGIVSAALMALLAQGPIMGLTGNMAMAQDQEQKQEQNEAKTETGQNETGQKKKSAAGSAPIGLVPEKAAIQIAPVVVTATKTETPLSQVGSSVSVITSEDLEDRKTVLVSDVLREVPGVAVNRTGVVGNLTQVRIRGAESNHTLVLIDGMEVNDASRGSEFDFADLLADDIERIEVLRGAQSTLYGSDAVGGVVNIITKQGDGATRFAGSLEGGSRMTGKANASVGGSTDKFRYYLSGTGYHTDGFSSGATKNGNSEKDGYDNTTFFGKVGISPSDKLDVDAVLRHTYHKAEYDATHPIFSYPVDADNVERGEQLFGHAQAKLKLFDGKWEHILGGTFTRQESRNYQDDRKTSDFLGKKKKVDYQSNLYLDTSSLVDAAHTFTIGYEHEIDSVDANSAFANLQRKITTDSYFGQYQIGLWDRLFITAGGRFDDSDLFENATTVRVTAAYLHKETGTKIRGSYGTGFKAPTIFELYGYTNNYRGNPNLKPEKSTGFDIGLEQSLLDDRITMSATYFNNRIEDLIQGSGRTSINLPGQSKIEGVEVSLGVEVVDNLRVTGTYTYTHGVDSNGDDLVRRPNHVASLNVNYRFLDDRANVNLGVEYNGKQKDWIFVTPRKTTTLDDYVLLNLAASYQVTDNLQVYGRLENLLNEDYEEVWGYGTAGRSAYLGLKASF